MSAELCESWYQVGCVCPQGNEMWCRLWILVHACVSVCMRRPWSCEVSRSVHVQTESSEVNDTSLKDVQVR